ncbi:MAG: hypothetical protein CSA38_02480 [Flavobacteriales bacterium]|nr:MAG: hypothetical protein CSA38_02480 [Flavobacteriales bacterium]
MRAIKLGVLLGFVFSFLMISCRKEDKKEVEKDLAVQFKVVSVQNAVIKSAVVQIGTKQKIDYTVTGTSWASEVRTVNTSAKFLSIAATGLSANNDSQLMVQIWVNGIMVAQDIGEVNAGSTNLSAKAYLNLNDLEILAF